MSTPASTVLNASALETNTKNIFEIEKNFLQRISFEKHRQLLDEMRTYSSTEQDAKKLQELLDKLYKYWHEGNSPKEELYLIPIFCVALCIGWEQRVEIIRNLMSGSERDYHWIHKPIIHCLTKTINLFFTSSQKLEMFKIFGTYITHISNEVRQLVTRILSDFIVEFRVVIEPMLIKIENEDLDREDVARFAKMGLDKLKSSEPRHGVIVIHIPQSGNQPDIKNNAEYQLGQKKLNKLEELLDEPFWFKNDKKVARIYTKAILYLERQPINRENTIRLGRLFGQIIFNCKYPINRKIHTTLFKRLIADKNQEVAQCLLGILSNFELEEFSLLTLKRLIEVINIDLVFSCSLRLNELFKEIFAYLMINRSKLTPTVFAQLATLNGSLKSAEITMPTVLQFFNSILFDFTAIPTDINIVVSVFKKIALCCIPYEFYGLEVLENFASNAVDPKIFALANTAVVTYKDALRKQHGEHFSLFGRQTKEEDNTTDWLVWSLLCSFRKKDYGACWRYIKLYEDGPIKFYFEFNSFIDLIKSKVLYAQEKFDEALKVLNTLEREWPFSSEVHLLKLKILFVKRQKRLSEEHVKSMQTFFPGFKGLPRQTVDKLSGYSQNHSVIVYQPMKLQIEELTNELMVALEKHDENLYKNFQSKLDRFFGKEFVSECAKEYGFNLQLLINDFHDGDKKRKFFSERKRYITQFLEYVIKLKVNHYYTTQYSLFKANINYQTNILAQLEDSKITDIYNRVNVLGETINSTRLLEYFVRCGITILPIFNFIKQYSCRKDIVGSFSLGVSYDIAKSYDTMVELFGLQSWAFTYGEFYIRDIDDKIHTPKLLDCITNDRQRRNIVFFIPTNIYQQEGDSNITYNEISWIMRRVSEKYNKLDKIIFVLDAYNYLPFHLLEKETSDADVEVDVENSMLKVRDFVELQILETASERHAFKQVQEMVKKHKLSPTIYQHELLYHWIKIVSFSKLSPSTFDDLKLKALEIIKKYLEEYFAKPDADKFIKDVKSFENSLPENEKNKFKTWLKRLVNHPDFKDVMKLSAEQHQVLINDTVSAVAIPMRTQINAVQSATGMDIRGIPEQILGKEKLEQQKLSSSIDGDVPKQSATPPLDLSMVLKASSKSQTTVLTTSPVLLPLKTAQEMQTRQFEAEQAQQLSRKKKKCENCVLM